MGMSTRVLAAPYWNSYLLIPAALIPFGICFYLVALATPFGQ